MSKSFVLLHKTALAQINDDDEQLYLMRVTYDSILVVLIT